MARAGEILEGKYELIRPIGQGGMGLVFEARHLGVDRNVAVKILSEELSGKDKARARFHREARAAGRIDHDNLCDVLDLGMTDDGTPFYVMPLLEGETLAERLEKEEQLDLEGATDILFQLLDALATAHGKGVIHRDLKPENIFLTRLGDRQDFVKILDFGITKFGVGVDEDGEETTLTDTGAVMGTPHYMAPEQAKGEADVDGRVDLYALGLILYRMLTGARAVDGDSHNEVLWNIWNAPIKPPRRLRPELSIEIETVMVRAMARDRKERYPTAERFREELESALRQTGQTHRGAVDVTFPTAEYPPYAQTESSKKGTGKGTFIVFSGVVLAVLTGAGLWWLFSSGEGDDATSSEAQSLGDLAPSSSPLPTLDASPREVDAAALVKVTLVDLPEGAEATIDGRRVVLPVFEVPRSREPLEVVLRADGYEEERLSVTALEDAVLKVRLRPSTSLRQHARPPLNQNRSDSRPSPRKAPVRSFREMP